VVSQRDALYLIMTGETFNGSRAAEMRLVNEAVPRERLRERTAEVAAVLAAKNPHVLRAAKVGFKKCRQLSWDQAEDYLYAKLDAATGHDPEQAKQQGLHHFLDEKAYRPGLGHHG
jgi:trans-feruloyl-CoA hydratase/vanillin synthase